MQPSLTHHRLNTYLGERASACLGLGVITSSFACEAKYKKGRLHMCVSELRLRVATYIELSHQQQPWACSVAHAEQWVSESPLLDY